MKNIIILFTFLWAVASYAVAPYGVKGQAQPGTLYSNVHQFPNNQVTNLGGINALVETGNTNLLANPSFEHSTVLTSWLPSFGPPPATTETPVEELTTIIDGKKSLKFVPSSEYVTIYQDSTLYAANFADSVHGAVSSWVHNTSPNLYLCARRAGILVATSNGTSITNCLKISEDGKWNQYVLPVILGGTSNGVALISLDPTTASTTTTSGTTYVDSMSLAAGDVRQAGALFKTDVYEVTNSANGFGSSYTLTPRFSSFSKNVSQGVLTYTDSPTLGAFWVANSDCDIEVNVSGPYLTAGNPQLKIFKNQSGVSTGDIIGIIDIAANLRSPLVATARLVKGDKLSFYYSSASVVRSTEIVQIRATLTENNTTYSSQNADTDWASCGHTTGDFTGFGTVSAIETQCKRQGSDLLMRGKFTSGTTTAVEARLNLKLNGASLTSAGITKIPSIQSSGVFFNGAVTTVAHGGPVLTEPSVGYATFGNSQTFGNISLNPIVKANGDVVSTSSSPFSFTARIPIAGWENSNQIIGSFKEVMTVPGVSKPKTCHYAFGGAGATLASPTECTSGTCVEVIDTCGTGSPPSWNATALYSALTFASGTFSPSTPVDCDCKAYDVSTSSIRTCYPYFVTGQNSWASNVSGGYSVNIAGYDPAGAQSTVYISVKCTGSAP